MNPCFAAIFSLGPAESNKAEKKDKHSCGLNRWVSISQTGATVNVQLWKPPYKGPKNQTPGENRGRLQNGSEPPHSLIFSNAQRRSQRPAALGKALCRQYLAYPLASFDISGQQPLFVHTPHANEDLPKYYWHSFRDLSTSMLSTFYGKINHPLAVELNLLSGVVNPDLNRAFQNVFECLTQRRCQFSAAERLHARLRKRFRKKLLYFKAFKYNSFTESAALGIGSYVSKTFRHEKIAFLDCARPALSLHERAASGGLGPSDLWDKE